MTEITKVILENEMDLILAHKQSMRLAELTGLSLPAQTTFATAVSELSRSVIDKKTHAALILYLSDKKDKTKFITAVLEDKRTDFSSIKDEGYNYAKRLVSNISSRTENGINRTELNYRLPATTRIDDEMTERWRIHLNTDPSVSPYEEIKRKNRQLVELADRLRDSEQQYKSLTDSLPIMIFSLSPNGKIIYANRWLQEYTGLSIEEINNAQWQNVVHPDEFSAIWENWEEKSNNETSIITPERRLKNGMTGEYRWHTGVSIAIRDEDGNIKCWNSFMVDVHAQKIIAQTLKDNKELKETQAALEEKIMLLDQSNHQLEQFAYIASHDLQEPLRKIGFYSDFIQQKYEHTFPEEAGVLFSHLVNATYRMKTLIQDILAYSTVRNDGFTTVDLNEIAADTLQDLEIGIKEKNAEIKIGPLPQVQGNSSQLKQLFENLVSNSLKFSKADIRPQVSIVAEIDKDSVLLSFKDNGIGFEEKYMQKMFDLFQRLHTRDKYGGTGIGLAICKKIVELHNGSITATGIPDEGATFLIRLPLIQNN